MPRPIDSDRLYNEILSMNISVGGKQIFHPAVKHGKWFYGAEYAGVHEVDCSVCWNYANDYYDFCPNCGAKMEE